MKVRILSDIHLEFEPFTLSYYGEDVLVLAGDISSNIKQTMSLITKYIKDNHHPQVVFILGNHDYYSKTIKETEQYYEKVNINRFHYLQDNSVLINGVRFYGTTLWTDMDNGNREIMSLSSTIVNDYYQIKGPFTAAQSYHIHCESKKHLIKCLYESIEPVVVVSHHLPSYKSIDPKYKSFPVNGSFASHIDDIVVKARMWIHGHTHTNLDYMIDNTRVICNPKGYNDENKNFNEKLIIEI
jgi:predicted phosphohydrolase